MPAKAPPPDPDHHLVNNRGVYCVCCSINATRATKEKLNFSLLTEDLALARHRRDVFLHGLQQAGLEIRMRTFTAVTLPPLRRQDRTVPWETLVRQALEKAQTATHKKTKRQAAKREPVPA